MNRFMELLDQPFLRNKEIAELLRVSPSSVTKLVKEHGLKKWPWGYSTDELIKKLGLQSYISRQKKKAPSPTKVESAK